MTKQENITQTLVNKIVYNLEKGNTSELCDVWDSKTSGFGIRVGKNNASFIFKYRNKANKAQTKTFGKVTEMSVAEARNSLDVFKPTIKSDLATIKKANKKYTVKDLCEKYLAEHQTRETTKKQDESRIERHILPTLGDIPLHLLTAKDIMNAQTAIANGDKKIVIAGHKNPNNPHSYIKVSGGQGVAKRVMEMLKTILNFAEDQELIEENPMNSRKYKKIKYNKKETAYLENNNYEELGYLLKKHEQQSNKSNQSVLFIKLLALTGCRKGELLDLTWDRVDFTNQYFVFAKTKTTGEQKRYFGSAAKRLLVDMHQKATSDYLFPSVTKKGTHRKDCLRALKQICKTAQENKSQFDAIQKLTLHGLRHSFSTMCNTLSFPDVIREGLMGHKKGGVQYIYTHNTHKTMIAHADQVSESINTLLNTGCKKAELENK